MLPPINAIGPALLGAFAVDSIIKFGEMVAKDTREIYGLKDAQKALNEAGSENIKILEDQARASMSYARSQLALINAGVAQQTRYVQQLQDWEDERIKWGGWFSEKAMQWSGALEKIQGEEQKLKDLEKLRGDLVKILGEDEVKEHEQAAEAAKKAEKQTGEYNRGLERQLGIRIKLGEELRKQVVADAAAMAHEAEGDRIMQRLTIDTIAESQAVSQLALNLRSLAPTIAVQAQEAQRASIAFRLYAEAMHLSALANQEAVQTGAALAQQIAGTIGGRRAEAGVECVFEVAKGIQQVAMALDPYDPHHVQHALSAAQHFDSAVQFGIVAGKSPGHHGGMSGGGGGSARGGYGGGGGAWAPPQTVAPGAAGGSGNFGSLGSGIIVVHGSQDLHQFVAGLVNGAVDRGITVTATSSMRGAPVGH
jgi:hypothetical protein